MGSLAVGESGQGGSEGGGQQGKRNKAEQTRAVEWCQPPRDGNRTGASIGTAEPCGDWILDQIRRAARTRTSRSASGLGGVLNGIEQLVAFAN